MPSPGEQGMGRFGDPLGALVHGSASARRQGRTRSSLGTPDAWAAGRIQRCRLRHHRDPARPGDQAPRTDYTNLLHGLAVLWPSYLAYALTFLFIGQVWANHHVMFDHIRAADRVILLLNTLLLMIVAFLPFATSVLAGRCAADTACG
jgi:hypothetical protein